MVAKVEDGVKTDPEIETVPECPFDTLLKLELLLPEKDI